LNDGDTKATLERGPRQKYISCWELCGTWKLHSFWVLMPLLLPKMYRRSKAHSFGTVFDSRRTCVVVVWTAAIYRKSITDMLSTDATVLSMSFPNLPHFGPLNSENETK